MTKETEEKYGLLDKAQIEKVVTSNDILVANAQDLSQVNTPYGPQPTTLKHWEAHDMALINVEDLKKLFAIVQRDYPEIYTSMQEYMAAKYFHGFNTFVLRKDLFDEMCTFEFDVLTKLEKQVDISHYNQQLSRIYGFMGEILFSSFVYHMKKTRKCLKIKECQMLYFDKTDPVKYLQPDTSATVKVVFDVTRVPEFLLYPALATFAAHTQDGKQYEAIILHNHMDGKLKKIYEAFIGQYKNITLKFQSVEFFEAAFMEKYGKVAVYAADILAWLLPDYARVLYLRWNVLIEAAIDDLYDIPLQNKLVAAVKDIYYQGKLNTFYKDEKIYAEDTLGIKDIFSFINTKAMVMDLAQIRSLYTLNNIAQRARLVQNPEVRIADDAELFNSLYQDYVLPIEQKWNYLVPSNGDMRFFLNEAPLDLSKAHKAAAKEAVIETYEENAPWFIDNDYAFYIKYWQILKNSPVEEVFRNHLIVRNSGNKMDARQITWTYIDTIFPKGSHRREVLKKMFPKKGLVYRTLKKLVKH